MDDVTVNLLRDQIAAYAKSTDARFDRIEAQNDRQLDLMTRHIELDEANHKVTERHSTYFKILSVFIPALITAIATKLGLKQP